MSRHNSSKAYGFRLQHFGVDHWRMFWTVDFYYATSRIRFPRVLSRDTDTDGAKRFAKRHGLSAPPQP